MATTASPAPDAERFESVDVSRLREIADTLPTMVFTARPDGLVEFSNARFRQFTGHDPHVALEQSWDGIVHPDDRQRVAAAWRHALGTDREFSVELRLRRKDGSYVWAFASAAALRDDAGRIVRWFGNAVDIDARKRAESALVERDALLRDSERRFRVLAEAIPVICWTADADGWIDWYNHRWYEYTGQTVGEAAGWGWQAAHHPDDFLEVMRRWPHSIATGESFEMEFRLRGRDGAFHWFLTRIEPLRNDSGQIVRWYGSNVDIDAQRQALERTKRVAETLQDIFLPKTLPQRDGLRIDAVYLPAEKDALVGGDWFDAFELPDGRLAFSIGDVAGHGLDASITVGRVKQAIFTLAFRDDDPAAILREVDRILTHQEPGTMVTALVGFVDVAHETLTFASAGHPCPMIAYTNDRPASLLPHGSLPLGTGFGTVPATHRVRLAQDAIVAVYTDGMIEFSGDIVGAEARLQAAVGLLVGDTHIARPASAVQQLVFNDMPARDDAALLLLQFSHVNPATLRTDRAPPLQKQWRFHSSDAYTAHTSRREIVEYLRLWAADPAAAFAGELIVGEILANTVEHAPGLVEVYIDWTNDQPSVTVRDTGPGLRSLVAVLPENPLAEGGRGIFLISALAEQVSVRPGPGYGTELYAVLPIKRKETAQFSLELG
jgi:PAS domain S-box-containing protein